MQILCDEKCNTHAVILTTAEAKALYEALLHATEPAKEKAGEPLNRRSAAFKVAFKVANELNIW